jgi:dipeptidyl aminopeptidase/acylaminoacyl peptidase
MKARMVLALLIGALGLALNGRAQAPDRNDPLYQSKGDQKRAYKFPGTGERITYRTYVPTTWAPGKKMPLIVVLHGGGLTEDAPFDGAPENLKGILAKTAEQRGYIVASPRGYGPGGGYGSSLPMPPQTGPYAAEKPPAGEKQAPPAADRNAAPKERMPSVQQTPEERAQANVRSEQDVLNILEIVAQEYNVDRSKVFLMGNSMGMLGTFHLAAKYPEKWLAIAPSDGPFDPDGYQYDKLKVKGVLVTHGDLDYMASRPASFEIVRRIAARGIEARHLDVPGGAHGSAWYMALPQIFNFFDKYAKK